MLNKLLEEEGLPREKVFITNTVKCRPPNNRPPKQEEMDACLPCLESELEGRKVIVTLGRSAAKDLLKREVSMKDEVNRPLKIRSGIGRSFSYRRTTRPPASTIPRSRTA